MFGLELSTFIIIITGIFFVLWIYSTKNIEGLNYHPFSDASAANPIKQLSGNNWTKNSHLKNRYSQTSKRTLKLNNFDVLESFRRQLSVFKNMSRKKSEIYINPLELTKSLIMLAPMGGGKTVTLESLLLEPWYNRALINDEKAGDSVSKLYNKRKDTILCPYDERASTWNVLQEDIEIVEFFIENILNAAVGDQKNFFSNDAKERYLTIAQLTIDIEETKEKWKVFIDSIEHEFKMVEESDSKSAKDVVSTMKQIIKLLKLMAYQIEIGKKSFTINQFFSKNHQNKIFMVTVDKYAISLNSLFTAFTACFAMIHASQKETKDDFTFYCLDEYISLKMNIAAKKILHTKIRSKGGCLLCAMQYLPSDKDTFDLLTSSVYCYLIFSVKNINTREYLDKQAGMREYIVSKTLNKNYQENTVKSNILDWSEIDKLAKNHQHITYLPEDGSLYVSKSDYTELPLKNESFILDPSIKDFKRKLNKEYQEKLTKEANTFSATNKYSNV